MNKKCDNCKGVGVEPDADGLDCHVCRADIRKRKDLSYTTGNLDVAGSITETITDYFIVEAIVDVASTIGTGVGNAAECTGEVLGTIAECTGDIIGSAFD